MPAIAYLKFKEFLKTSGMLTFAHSLKTNGFKNTLAKYGWKFFAVAFFCYLLRDVTIYILFPLLAAHNLTK